MEIKTGIDLIEIERIRESVLKNPRFLNKYFGDEEIELFGEKRSFESLAGNFAVKEAFSKAMGTGIRGFSLCEVQTLRDEMGAPYVKLSGKALELFSDFRISVSISHSKTDAAAVVVAYKD